MTLSEVENGSVVEAIVINNIRQDLNEKGYHCSHGFNEADLLTISGALGIPTADKRGEIVKTLKPEKPSDPNRSTLSSKYGTGAFPFHTETAYWLSPARFVALYCVNPGSSRRPTHVIDSYEWNLSPNDDQTLCNEVWKVFTGINPFLCTIGKKTMSGLMIRFDMDCMKPALLSRGKASDIVFREIESQKVRSIDWQVGDLLVIDNYRMIHARGTSSTNDSDRHLKRILLVEKGD